MTDSIVAAPITIHMGPDCVIKTHDMLVVERLQSGGLKVKEWLTTLIHWRMCVSYDHTIPEAVNDSGPDKQETKD